MEWNGMGWDERWGNPYIIYNTMVNEESTEVGVFIHLSVGYHKSGSCFNQEVLLVTYILYMF